MAEIALKKSHKAHPPGTPDKRVPIDIGSDLPPDVVRFRKASTRVRSGKLRLKQVEWCNALVADWFLMSLNALCRKYHTDKATAHAVIQAYSEQGKLPDSRAIALRKAERLQDLASDCLKEHYEQGRVSPRDSWIGWGIATDKIAMLNSGVIPGTEGKTQVEVDANAQKAVLEVFERLKALKAGEPQKAIDLPAQVGGEGVSDAGSGGA